jgi:hypothetical protein
MHVDIQIRIRDGKIFVDADQKNYQREFKNLLGLIANSRIVSVGQSLDDLIKENPQNEDKFREEVTFEPLYTASAHGLDNLQFFVEFVVMQLRQGNTLFSRLRPEAITCRLEIPDYESIDEDIRKLFEFSLTKFVVRELRINDGLRGWEKWHRVVLEMSRPVLLFLWPLLWYLFVAFMSRYVEYLGLSVSWIIYIAAFAVFYYFAVLLRVLILKNILPHDLLKSELLSPRVRMGKFGAFLANKLFDTK